MHGEACQKCSGSYALRYGQCLLECKYNERRVDESTCERCPAFQNHDSYDERKCVTPICEGRDFISPEGMCTECDNFKIPS